MNKKKRIVILAALLILAAIGIGAGLTMQRYYWTGSSLVPRDIPQLDLRGQSVSVDKFLAHSRALPQCEILWDVPFQGSSYPSDTDTLKVSSLSQADLEMLRFFPQLTLLEAEGCRDYENLTAFREERPSCAVRYTVALGDSRLPWDSREITVADVSKEELTEALRWLPAVTQVHVSGTQPGAAALMDLQQQHPTISFRWEIALGDLLISSEETELDLREQNIDPQGLTELLAQLPNAEKLDLRGCGYSVEDMLALVQAHPDRFFLWEVDVAGLTFLSDAEEIDITRQKVTDPAQVEKLLPCFPYLKKVDMSHCGLDNETMYALDNRHEDVRFVWTLKVQDCYLRTDTEYFYPWKLKHTMDAKNEDMELLKYCPDIISVDIGHMWFITDCEWVKYIPKLEYLILGETRISDLGPLSQCKNLKFLEIFTIPVTDYSPLIGCTALEDLNLGRTYGDPAPLTQMTWLKNVWWANVDGTSGLPCSNAKAVLTEALPNTNLRFDLEHPTADGWRKLENYFNMRDVMGVHYMQ